MSNSHKYAAAPFKSVRLQSPVTLRTLASEPSLRHGENGVLLLDDDEEGIVVYHQGCYVRVFPAEIKQVEYAVPPAHLAALVEKIESEKRRPKLVK